MFGERAPSASDPVLHVGGFLVHECGHLHQMLYFSFGSKSLDMHLVDFDSSQLGFPLVWLDLGFVWVKFQSLRFRTFSKSAIFFFELFQRVRHHEHVVSEAQI